MKKSLQLISLIVLIAASAITSYADDTVLAARIDSIMSQAAQNDNYHITAKQLNNWMKMKKDDFLVVDIRFAPKDGSWGQPKHGRIPGSIHIPHSELFKQENLNKLPKDKKLVLVGHMNVHENYSIVPLRLLGYNSYSLLLGMSGWQKDYPAGNHLNMLINAPKHMDFPVE